MVPATWEVETEGSESKADSDKNERPYLKNKPKVKGLEGHDSRP
jgi:hypothetical protein